MRRRQVLMLALPVVGGCLGRPDAPPTETTTRTTVEPCTVHRPTPDGTPLELARTYPQRPIHPTDESVADYVGDFERAHFANSILAEASPPDGMVVAEIHLDVGERRVRTADEEFFVGLTVNGVVGYSPDPERTTSSTSTPTPVPGITVHSAASYRFSERALYREGRDYTRGVPPAEVSDGTVVACYDD